MGKKTPQWEWDETTIRALRRHLELTQRQMAAQLGTRQQTISEWENGLYRPRGTSATLLTIVADRAEFRYGVAVQGDKQRSRAR